MAIIDYQKPWTRQPQIKTKINWNHPLTTGLRALFSGAFPGFDLVHNTQFLVSGSPTKSVGAAGRIITTSTVGGSYDGWYPPEQSSGSGSANKYDILTPPLTLFIVGTGSSGVNFGAGITRGNGSGTPAYSLGFWDGSFEGVFAYYKTGSGEVSISPSVTGSPTDIGVHTAVLTVTATSVTAWLDGVLADTAATPAGNIYLEYNDQYRCLNLGGAFTNGPGSLSLAGEIGGVAWTQKEVLEFHSNPWAFFEPQHIYIPVAGGGAAEYTFAVSGGVSFAGSAAQLRTRIAVPSGGVAFAGTAPNLRTRVTSSGGAVTFSGTAPITNDNIYTITPSGGVQFSGAVPQLRERVLSPSGGVTFGGSARLIFVPVGGVTQQPTRIDVGVSRVIGVS